jgi:hypothetical protein
MFNPKVSPYKRIRFAFATCALLAAASIVPVATAQTSSSTNTVDSAPSQDFAPVAKSETAPPTASTLPEAPRTERYPLPGQPAPVLTGGDKLRMAATGAISPFAITGWLGAAGYEQLTNSSPNWGTDRGAFGMRLRDAGIRATTEDFLSDGVFAPLFHEDPRYFRLGHGHKFLARAIYAATRPLITRNDSGRNVPNLSLISGNLVGSALTNLYYPQNNRSLTETLSCFGSGLGGSAVGFGVAEFFGGLLFDHHTHSSH